MERGRGTRKKRGRGWMDRWREREKETREADMLPGGREGQSARREWRSRCLMEGCRIGEEGR